MKEGYHAASVTSHPPKNKRSLCAVAQLIMEGGQHLGQRLWQRGKGAEITGGMHKKTVGSREGFLIRRCVAGFSGTDM